MSSKNLHDLFSTQAESAPSSLAVVVLSAVDSEPQCFTYHQLHEMIRGLSYQISDLIGTADGVHGIGSGQQNEILISLMCDRHVGLIASMFAVRFSSATYVCIDPQFPPERQSYIFEHSKSAILIADENSYLSALHRGVNLPPIVMVITSLGLVSRIIRNASNDNRTQMHRVSSSKSSLMYVLYTSGSTGRPKGVMIEERSVVNVLDYFKNALGVGAGSRVLGITTISFDISVLEIFLPLIAGGTLVLAPTSYQRNPFDIIDAFEMPRVEWDPVAKTFAK